MRKGGQRVRGEQGCTSRSAHHSGFKAPLLPLLEFNLRRQNPQFALRLGPLATLKWSCFHSPFRGPVRAAQWFLRDRVSGCSTSRGHKRPSPLSQQSLEFLLWEVGESLQSWQVRESDLSPLFRESGHRAEQGGNNFFLLRCVWASTPEAQMAGFG